MTIGVPKEIMNGENRVGMTPKGVFWATGNGHSVLVEQNAGSGSSLEDAQYVASGAEIVSSAAEVWARADLIVKIKQPIPSEYPYFRDGLILFSFLHLAANRELTWALMEAGMTAIAYETIEEEDGELPLLAPMSEVAGRMATQVGARMLETGSGGRGILLGGVAGVGPAHVVVLGGGVVGINAARVALGMGAQVTIMDVVPRRMRYLEEVLHGRFTTLHSYSVNVQPAVRDADLVIGCVLVPGAPAPTIVEERTVMEMKPGSAIVDVAVDQGGCVETIHVTSHDNPTYVLHGVVHYGVPNMPGAVPHTATWALTAVSAPFVLDLAGLGLDAAVSSDRVFARGVNVRAGKVVHPVVAKSLCR
ncbi:MAG: alanine dehydrogenase [Candidatus Latescibacterota bacterium]